MVESSKPVTLKEYAAGALLANAPIWIFRAIIPSAWLEGFAIIAMLITYTITMASGVYAGYLIARKTGQSYQRAGLPTGLFAYSLYAVFMTVTGVKGGFIEDVPALFGFLVGAAVGARYWEKRNQQRPI